MADAAPTLILASASPRRAELLAALGVPFIVSAADVDETPLAGEAAAAYVERLARAKAAAIAAPDVRAVAPVVPAPAAGALVVAADTTVVLDGRLLGKPADAADATATLGMLAGRTHEVCTGVAVAPLGDPAAAVVGVCTTSVRFRALDDAEIDRYVATGEPLDKAGSYGIQGLGGLLVDGIDGSYPNVVGLPLTTLDALLRTFGHPLATFARR
jgi:septum formation protein